MEDFSMDDAVIRLIQKANVLCYKDKNNESSLNTKTNSQLSKKGWKGNRKRLFSNAEVSINGWKTIFFFCWRPSRLLAVEVTRTTTDQAKNNTGLLCRFRVRSSWSFV